MVGAGSQVRFGRAAVPSSFIAVMVALLLAGAAVLPGRFLDAKARAAAPLRPDDRGRVALRGGWTQLQWNFVGPFGVDAPQAWGNLIAAGSPGGAGVIVAVLDTGVAYPGRTSPGGGSPDLSPSRFVPGYDFIDNDPDPFDNNGHGTHVASTIAEQTNNGYGLTGLAYGVRIMPVRVLDAHGEGDADTIARGVRFATQHGAKVINLSLNFSSRVTSGQIPALLSAIEDAHRGGVLVVAGAGNTATPFVSYPARGPHVLAVGATTEEGCLANYSNYGVGLDLVAPGGGDGACGHGRPIYQITMSARSGRFDISGYAGTSMAAPHVAATAALIIASRVIGADPSPAAIEARLESTARDLGSRGRDDHYGWGLVDAGAATCTCR
jgi:serine protease